MNYEEFLEATDEKEVLGYIKIKNNPIQLYFDGMLMHMLKDHKAHIGVVNGLTDAIDLDEIENSIALKKRVADAVEYNDLGLVESYDVEYHKEDGSFTLENENTYILFYILES